MLEQYNDVLTKKDLSQILKLSLSTLDTMCSRNRDQLPTSFKLGDAKNSPIRFLKSDVIDFLNAKVDQQH